MKKALSIVLTIIVIMCFGLFAIGCSSTGITAATSASESTTKETTEETTKATTEATTVATTEQDDDDEEDEDEDDEDEDDEDEDDGEVDPELKAFLDSYEAYYDEYIDFMLKYNENPSDITLMTEYANMMIKLNEFTEAAEKYDSEEMSAADRRYYVEVLTRVQQKLMDASITISE